MKVRLTLAIKKSTIEKAEIIAKRMGKSLSAVIENYLEMVDAESSLKPDKLSNLRGVVTLPYYFNEKEELQLELSKKHL
ncbi:MAG: DUF6364 family protein [Bacteroidota bacterium]